MSKVSPIPKNVPYSFQESNKCIQIGKNRHKIKKIKKKNNKEKLVLKTDMARKEYKANKHKL